MFSYINILLTNDFRNHVASITQPFLFSQYWIPYLKFLHLKWKYAINKQFRSLYFICNSSFKSCIFERSMWHILFQDLILFFKSAFMLRKLFNLNWVRAALRRSCYFFWYYVLNTWSPLKVLGNVSRLCHFVLVLRM